MKKTLATALLLGLSLTAYAEPKTLFTINGTPVTDMMMQQLAGELLKPGMKPSAEIQQVLATEMANRILLSQAAVADKLDQDPVNQAGLEMKRVGFLANLALKKQLDQFRPTDEELKSLYDKDYSQPTKEYKARHILLKEKADAEKVIGELKQGGNFADLAKQRSTGPSGPQGGDLGWFSLDSMVKPFADAVATLPKGSYSQAPVQTQFGWHVILSEDSRELPAKPFEQMKPELIAQLRQDMLQNYLGQLHAKANIQQGSH